jgi:hypothetical protein
MTWKTKLDLSKSVKRRNAHEQSLPFFTSIHTIYENWLVESSVVIVSFVSVVVYSWGDCFQLSFTSVQCSLVFSWGVCFKVSFYQCLLCSCVQVANFSYFRYDPNVESKSALENRISDSILVILYHSVHSILIVFHYKFTSYIHLSPFLLILCQTDHFILTVIASEALSSYFTTSSLVPC